MAIFRKVHTSFWSDSFISDLDNDKKLFYIYLMTNEKTRQCGVYEITKKQMAFDLGYSMDKVSILLKYFISKGKIRYNDDTKELALGNWLKYNSSTSPKVKTCIDNEFKLVKDTLLIEYVKSMDTHTQEEQEEEQEEEKKQDKEIKENLFETFWNLYDKKVERKSCYNKFMKLDLKVIEKIINVVPFYVKLTPDIKYRKNPETWINGECWNDEIKVTTNLQNTPEGYAYNSKGELIEKKY
jgi:hypothetical protein